MPAQNIDNDFINMSFTGDSQVLRAVAQVLKGTICFPSVFPKQTSTKLLRFQDLTVVKVHTVVFCVRTPRSYPPVILQCVITKSSTVWSDRSCLETSSPKLNSHLSNTAYIKFSQVSQKIKKYVEYRLNMPLLSNTVSDTPSGPSLKAGICDSRCREWFIRQQAW
jgi:hypothetical protein